VPLINAELLLWSSPGLYIICEPSGGLAVWRFGALMHLCEGWLTEKSRQLEQDSLLDIIPFLALVLRMGTVCAD
jgi:hypothetical protein